MVIVGPAKPGSMTYPVLLALGAVDAAGYSVIGPVLPALAARLDAGPAVMGALVSAFPLAMLVGFAAAGRLVRLGGLRLTVGLSIGVAATGSVVFALTSSTPALFAARALMGLGSGGLWIAVTLATLAYWPGQEYLCISRIYAAYSVGALLGPSLGALGGVRAPFLAYAALLLVLLPGLRALRRAPDRAVGSDTSTVRTTGFWVAAVAIMLAILAIGALDGVLPLHFAVLLSQTQIGLMYAGVAALIAIGSTLAGHYPPVRVLIIGAAALTVGLTLAGATTFLASWSVALVLLGLGAGLAQTGATGLLLAAIPIEKIVTALIVWSQLGILGYLAGPVVGGLIAEHLGYAALGLLPVAVVAVLLLLAVTARRSGTR